MADRVAPDSDPLYTPRNTIPFCVVPVNLHNSCYSGSTDSKSSEYALILDCVFEMADAIATGNGVAIEVAIEQVLKDEGWNVLPQHRRLITTIWRHEDGQMLGTGSHLYSIGTQRGERIFNIEVRANNRDQAAKTARINGFRVRDVNMVG